MLAHCFRRLYKQFFPIYAVHNRTRVSSHDVHEYSVQDSMETWPTHACQHGVNMEAGSSVPGGCTFKLQSPLLTIVQCRLLEGRSTITLTIHEMRTCISAF